MTIRFSFIAFLLLIGCSDTKRPEPKAPESSFEKLQREAKETVDAAAGAFNTFTGDAQKAYNKRLNEGLLAINTKLDELKKSATTATADARKKIDEAVKTLEVQRSALDSKMKEMQSATEDTWQRVKSGADKELENAKQMIDSVTGGKK